MSGPIPQPYQVQNFRDLARQLECDEDEAAFEATVRKVANSSVQQPSKDQDKP
jgi:hypothetical protein